MIASRKHGRSDPHTRAGDKSPDTESGDKSPHSRAIRSVGVDVVNGWRPIQSCHFAVASDAR